MEYLNSEMDELWGKILSGNANKEEITAFELWLKASPENKQEFQEYKRIWDASRLRHHYDLEKARINIYHKVVSQGMGKNWWYYWQRVAAFLFIPLFLVSVWGGYIVWSDFGREQIVSAYSPKGQFSKITLGDGTEVWLNAESELTYDNHRYGKMSREVQLTGEGYFNVAKDKSKPFIVKVNGNRIHALGTAFNVNAYDVENMRITLEKGKIKVSNDLHDILLNPGEQALITQSGEISKSDVDPQLFTTWHEGKIIFKDESLGNMAIVLERMYGVSIHFANESIKEYRYRGVLKYDNSIFHFLDILNMTTDIKFEMHGKDIFVYQ